MNVAYLLVTTAWLTGADPIPVTTGQQPNGKPDVKPAPALVAPTVTGGYGSCGGCGTSCNDCCEESWGSRLCTRIRGLFSRNNDCCNTCTTQSTHGHHATGCCNAPAQTTCCNPAPACNTCNTHVGHGHSSGCNECGESWGSRLRERLRGLFHRSNDCCDTCAPACNGCGGGGVYGGAPIKTGEPIPGPKTEPPVKMPEGGKEPDKGKEPEKGKEPDVKKGAVAPIPPANQFPTNSPAIEGAPAIVNPPAIEPKRDF